MKMFLGILLILATVSAAAENDDRGARLAVTCAACHGAKGVSQNPLWPNLAGQKKDYLIKQLEDFKAGRRQNELMSPMAGTLSDRDIQDVAQHFSAL